MRTLFAIASGEATFRRSSFTNRSLTRASLHFRSPSLGINAAARAPRGLLRVVTSLKWSERALIPRYRARKIRSWPWEREPLKGWQGINRASDLALASLPPWSWRRGLEHGPKVTGFLSNSQHVDTLAGERTLFSNYHNNRKTNRSYLPALTRPRFC